MARVSQSDIDSLVRLFEESDWEELHVEMEGFRLDLSKKSGTVDRSVRAVQDTSSTPIRNKGAAAAAQPKAESAGTAGAVERVPDGWAVVCSPNLGTFYRAPKPGAPPFVEIGQEVQASTQVCIIEVMKLFTSVPAGVRGIVRKICAKDGDMVEHNHPLFVIEPAADT
jgi:acetyl-CoA carboxylase biotin carboxyl carrier protein